MLLMVDNGLARKKMLPAQSHIMPYHARGIKRGGGRGRWEKRNFPFGGD